MHTQPLIIDTVDSLSQQLAAILENLEQMQQREKPYLLALYQANLGELEYKLLTMQVECRALQQRIQLAMVYLNRGECLTEQKLQAIEQQVIQDLLKWRTQLSEQAQVLSAGVAYLQDLIVVDTNIVQRVKQAYRRLSRLLHPDVSPEHQTLFEHYWSSVQNAYRSFDADLLEALLHTVETAAAQQQNSGENTAEIIARLKMMVAKQGERLVQLRNEAPFCWVEKLHDEKWLKLQQTALEMAIVKEHEQWAILISRHADLVTRIQPEN
ncbi:MAG: J domain-containing protein [Methylococcales bacterium]